MDELARYFKWQFSKNRWVELERCDYDILYRSLPAMCKNPLMGKELRFLLLKVDAPVFTDGYATVVENENWLELHVNGTCVFATSQSKWAGSAMRRIEEEAEKRGLKIHKGV